ncbi:MAG: DUF4826 family protein [Gammaproteobacteria bacterium]|nr:DUF4826 family protein [Gammaproteobacteria bacterium]
MTESSADAERKALESWYKPLLDNVVKEMIRIKAISGEAVQATPVWMVPDDILMAKVWGVNRENDFVWTISVDKLIADYVAGSLAATPRDVARHFSLKWQMDAERLLSLSKDRPAVENIDPKVRQHSEQLVRYAETLYDLAGQDDAWEQLPTFAS